MNGGLDSENAFLSHVCKREFFSRQLIKISQNLVSKSPPGNSCIDVRCLVISVNYRHAPEHVYPTAIGDSFDGFQWIWRSENIASQNKLDPAVWPLGGFSA